MSWPFYALRQKSTFKTHRESISSCSDLSELQRMSKMILLPQIILTLLKKYIFIIVSQ